MKNKKNEIGLHVSLSTIFSILVAIFLTTKMIRSFSGSNVAGGIWNYIQIVFVLWGLLVIVRQIKYFTQDLLFFALLLYTVFSLFHGLIYLKISMNGIFEYMMVAYPICIIALVHRDARLHKIENNPIIVTAFYVISFIFVFSMLRTGSYSTLIGAVADVYYILCLFPLMCILTKDKYRILPIGICLTAVVISGKRLGIILCVCMIALHYAHNAIHSKKVGDFFSGFLRLAIASLGVICIFYIVNANYNNGLFYRFQRMLFEGDTSGRGGIWRSVIEKINSSAIRYWIIGHGSGAVYDSLGNNAHNDFLEIMYNFGVVPCAMYILFYVASVFELIKMFQNKYVYAMYFLMSVICSFGLALGSFYAIAPTYVTCGMLTVGYIYSDYKKYLLNLKKTRLNVKND